MTTTPCQNGYKPRSVTEAIAGVLTSAICVAVHGGDLRGIVTSVSDTPLAGAVIAATPEVPNALSDGTKAAKVTLSSSKGTFAFSDLPAGLYGLTSTLPGYEGTFLGKVVVPPVGPGKVIVVRMPEGGIPLEFRLGKTCTRWPQGTVVFLARASNDAGDLFYGSFQDGRYRLNLSQGQYWLNAEAPGCDPCNMSIEIPQKAGVIPIPLTGFGTSSELRKELLAMRKADQDARKWTGESIRNPESLAHAEALRVERMRVILHDNGWPTLAQVGLNGVGAVWLVVQHSVDLLAEKIDDICKAADNEELDKGIMATSLDRVLVNQGKLQRYGTQVRTRPDGVVEPFPMEDPKQVNARRSDVGLGTLESYLVEIRKVHLPSAAAKISN